MKYLELIAPCHFGMEAVLKREILDLGYEISKVEDGKVTFLADAAGIPQANVFLRTTERILLKTGEFKAQARLPSDDCKSAYYRNSCVSSDHAYTMEQRQNPCGSILRQRNLPY